MVLKGILKKKKAKTRRKAAKKTKKKARPRKKVKKGRARTKKKTVRARKVRKRAVRAKKVRKTRKVRKVRKVARKDRKPKLPPIIKMDDRKVYDTLTRSRIPVARSMFCRKEKDIKTCFKRVGAPAVMKVSGTSIIHKTESKGVVTVSSLEEAGEAFARLMKIKGAESVMFQKHVTGKELIIGAKSDPNFGHVISVGLGGIYAEVIRDVSFRICPIDARAAESMVRELKGYEILAGARGDKPIDFKALSDMISKLSRFVVKNKVKEIDINPVFCSHSGCWAADVRIIK